MPPAVDIPLAGSCARDRVLVERNMTQSCDSPRFGMVLAALLGRLLYDLV
jgi:hypothetical protein